MPSTFLGLVRGQLSREDVANAYLCDLRRIVCIGGNTRNLLSVESKLHEQRVSGWFHKVNRNEYKTIFNNRRLNFVGNDNRTSTLCILLHEDVLCGEVVREMTIMSFWLKIFTLP